VESAHWRELLRPEALLRHRPDVLHLHSTGRYARGAGAGSAGRTALAAAARLWRLRRAGVRLVWTAHDLQDHDSRHPRIDRALGAGVARLAGAIVVHGERAAGELRRRYRLGRRTRVVVVPHGPFTHYAAFGSDGASVRRGLGIAEDDFVFLFLGAVRAYKGVLELARAFRASGLAERRAHLVIRGRSREASLSRRLDEEAARCPRLHLALGRVPDAELASAFAAADAAPLPYRAVLTSGSAVLALSLGTPVIAPRLPGLLDLVDESCALLYDPAAPHALPDALVRAFERRAELPELGRRGRERATRTGWEEIAERTLEVYRS
jgi:beta-1,4-mannosyltransferase